MARTLSEKFVARINANVFFAEFAFDSAQLRLPGTGDVELADHLIVLDESGLIFQLKERDASASVEAAALTDWFAGKVRKKGVRQIAETRRLLRDHVGVPIQNQRGYPVPIPVGASDDFHGLVIYDAPEVVGFKPSQHCVSKSAGFVHFIRARDYFGVCQSLVTPTEVLDYLRFRSQAMQSLVYAPSTVSEEALVGQFMGGELLALPNERYSRALDALLEDRDDWDISFLTRNLGESITRREGDESDTSHYRILAELAKLTRSELRELKTRLRLTLEAVRADEYKLPYRFAVPRTDCGFLMFPVPIEMHDQARVMLQNYSIASKHEMRVSKHIAFYARHTPPYIDIEWMYMSGPPADNAEVDALLARNYPFRELKSGNRPRYRFDTADLRDAIGPNG